MQSSICKINVSYYYLEKLKKKGQRVSMDPYFDFLMKKREARGEQKMVKLTGYLLSNGMMEELQKALADEEARAGMYEKYGISIT